MGRVLQTYEFDFKFNDKNASKQLKAISHDVAALMAEMGNASDKVTIFKDLITYLDNVDRALSMFKAEHKDDFKNLFGGIDASITKQMEGLFGIDSKNMSVFASLKQQIDDAAANGAKLEKLKKIATSMNELFDNIGVDKKIDMSLFEAHGGSTKDRVDMLYRALDAATMKFQDVQDKLKVGFVVGGVRGGLADGIGKEVANIEQQIDAMEKQVQKYEDLRERFSDISYAKQVVTYEVEDELDPAFKAEYTTQAVKDLILAYEDAERAKENFERSGDTSSVEYYEHLEKMAKLAIKLSDVSDLSGRDSDAGAQLEDELSKDRIKGRKTNLLETFTNTIDRVDEFFDGLTDDVFGKIDDGIESKVNEITQRLSPLLYMKDAIASILNGGSIGYGAGGSGAQDSNATQKAAIAYNELIEKLREYQRLKDKENNSIEYDDDGEEVSDKIYKLDEYFDNLSKTKEEMDKIQNIVIDVADGLAPEDAIERLKEFLNITKEINSGAAADSTVDTLHQRLVSESEYIQGIAIQLQKLFDNINSTSTDIEYKILINGQEIDIKKAGSKETTLKDRIESYLGTVDKNTIVDAHNHPGGRSSQYNAPDLKSIIQSVYTGVSKLGAIVSEKDITTLNLAGVKLEDALKVQKQVDGMDVASITSENLNKLFENINPAYKNVAQTWDKTQLDGLAKFIYDVGANADDALNPLTKFQNILSLVANEFDKKIDFSKYQDLFDNFKVEYAGRMFNQIMGREGIDLSVDDLNVQSIDAFIVEATNKIREHKEELAKLRKESDVTYSFIQGKVKSYLSDIQNGGLGKEMDGFIRSYFDASDEAEISKWLIDLENNAASIDQVTNKIASYFERIDPSEYVMGGTNVAEEKLNDFYSLWDKINNQDYSGLTDIDIGKYVEKLDAAKTQLKEFGEQGLLTAEQLAKVDEFYVTAMSKLNSETNGYTGHGNAEDIQQDVDAQLQGFFKLANEASAYWSYDAEGNVEIGKYIERLETAKKALEELGQQGLISSEQLNEINETFNHAKMSLDMVTSHAYGYGHYDYSYEDELDKARAENDDLRAENERLRQSVVSSSAPAQTTDVDGAVQDKTGAFEQEGKVVDQVVDQEKIALGQLIERLEEVKKSVQAKTKAFYDEGTVVGQAVGKEIAALIKLKDELNNIETKINHVVDGISNINTNVSNVGACKLKDNSDEKEKRKQDLHETKPKTADEIAKIVAQKSKERELQKIQGQVNLEKGSLGFNFNARNLEPEQKEIVELYDKLIAEIDKYDIAVKNEQQAELKGIEDIKAALFEKIDAYKEANNIINAGKTGGKKAPGATVVKNATTKYNALKNLANTEELKRSQVVQRSLSQYKDAWQNLVNIQGKYKTGQILSKEQEQEFNDARVACNNYAKDLEKLLKTYQKSKDSGDPSKRYELEGDFDDTNQGRQKAFQDFLDQIYGANVTFEKFDDNFNKMVYTVDNGDGTFTKMTATINGTRTAIDVFAGETKKSTTALERWIGGFKKKLATLSQYLAANFGIHEVWQHLKQGVQHVREIDSALTELKKVTDETDATYDAFLQTMSKTAGVVGSTVKDLTTMSADWARLNI